MSPIFPILNKKIELATNPNQEEIDTPVFYGDYYRGVAVSVETLLQPLLKKNADRLVSNTQNSASKSLVRITLDKALCFDQSSKSELTSLLYKIKESSTLLILEFIDTDFHSKLDVNSEILELLSLADFIIFNKNIIHLLVPESQDIKTTLPLDILTKINHLIKNLLNDPPAIPALLFQMEETEQWLYCDQDKKAVFTFSFSSPVKLYNHSLLSATIGSFILLGKRLCDAVVLSFSYLKQNELHVHAANKFCFDGVWPTTLNNFPSIKTHINQLTDQPFPATDTLSLGLYPVVDTIEWLEQLLKLNIKTIQLRIKDTPIDALDDYIRTASSLGKKYHARLFINDYWQLAIKHDCYGVHLGQEDLDNTDLRAIQKAGLKLGISTHSEYEWLRAISIQPSYIAMGTVYPTQTKPAILIGLINLRDWCQTLANEYPIVAIGGITLNNIDPVLDTGVGSTAVVTAITKASDFKQATESLMSKQRIQKTF